MIVGVCQCRKTALQKLNFWHCTLAA